MTEVSKVSEDFRSELESRMLSGEPFTYSGLITWRDAHDASAPKADADRLVDRTIQKLRRKRLIAWQRERGLVTWRPVQGATQ